MRQTAANRREAKFSWPERRGSYFEDPVRLVLEAAPSDLGLLQKLRAAQILTESETIVLIGQRTAWETSLPAGWIAGAVAAAGLPAVAAGLAASRSGGGESARLDALKLVADKVASDLDLYASTNGGVPLGLSDNWRRVRDPVTPPPSAASDAEKLRSLQEALVTILRISDELRRPPMLARHTNWAEILNRIALLKRPAPVATYDIVEDELFRFEEDISSRILDFHIEHGFLARGSDRVFVTEGEEIFVRVSGVSSGTVAILWQEELLTTTRAERGEDGFLPDTDSDESVTHHRLGGSESMASERPRSSLLLRVGEARAGRYEFSICVNEPSAASSEANKTCNRNGRHALVVHGSRYWGLRAGVGVSVFPRARNVQPVRLGTTNQYVINRADVTLLEPTVPILATLYALPRQLQRDSVDLGFVGGLNLLDARNEYYLGVHGGWGPVGLDVAWSFRRRRVSNAQLGDVVQSNEGVPNLNEGFGRSRVLDHGVMVAVTFDFDVFRRIYDAISKIAKLPSIGATRESSE